MHKVLDFEPQFATTLPETYALLRSAHLVIHPCVARIVLHGSRGPAGGYRHASDIDLSLIVDPLPDIGSANQEPVLRDIWETTFRHWQSSIELDLALIFDDHRCALKCFYHTAWNEAICALGGVDCFGLYKLQKGFNGLVTQAGVRVKLMYPCLKIWQRN
jgi:hypothetical protein